MRMPWSAARGKRVGRGVLSRERLKMPAVVLLLAFLLTRAGVGGAAPFAAGLTAAAGYGFAGAFAFAGTALGCLMLPDGLRNAAAAFLILAGNRLLHELPFSNKKFFAPCLAAVMNLCTGLVYVAADGWLARALTVLALETVLVGCSAFIFAEALASLDAALSRSGERALSTEPRQLCALLLTVCALMGLANVIPFGDASVGRFLAALLLLGLARAGGGLYGGAAGLLLGLGMDAMLSGNAFFTASFALCGFVSGIFRKKPRVLFALAYIITCAAATMWGGGEELYYLYEAGAAAALFMLVPEKLLEALPISNPLRARGERESVVKRRIRDISARRLEETARAYSELNQRLSDALSREASKDGGELSTVFSAAAGRICARCSGRRSCWMDEKNSARPACMDAGASLQRKGRLAAADFPNHFASRCVKIGDFTRAVNEEYSLMLDRRRVRVRSERTRELLCRQYSELSRMLSDAATELSRELLYHPELEEKLAALAQGKGGATGVGVWTDASGRLHALLEGEAAQRVSPAEAGAVLGVALEADEPGAFSQKEPLRAIAGSAASVRDGEDKSGDSATYFRSPSGALCVILSDGMGSGAEALRESRRTSALLESFIRAGVEPETALRAVNSALSIKSRSDGAFATLDLMQLDLFTGRAGFFKLGAAATYIKRGAKVSRLTSSALPPGVALGLASADVTRLTLCGGDFVVMASDGLSDRDEDGWLMNEISLYNGKSPRELAAALMQKAPAHGDDVTIFIIRLEPAA